MSEKFWDRANPGWEEDGLERGKKSDFINPEEVIDPGLNPEEELVAKEEESEKGNDGLSNGGGDENLREPDQERQGRRAMETEAGWSPKIKEVAEPVKKTPENVGVRKEVIREVGFLRKETKIQKRNDGKKPLYKEQRREASGF